MSDYVADSVFGMFAASAARVPERDFVAAPPLPGRAYHPDGIAYGYSETLAAIEALRARYAAAGYGRGHRVALLLEQRPEFFFHFLALNALGASMVPVNPDYRHDEILYQMEHSEADLAVVVDARRADMERVAAERDKPLPVLSFEHFPDTVPAPAAAAATGAPGLADEVAILYTSGTTGRPKGCILTNEYFLNTAEWYRSRGGMLALGDGERAYNPLPLFHMNCLVGSAATMMLTGGCLIVPDRFHPGRWWRDLVETRATIMHYLGVVPPLLLNQPPVPEERQHGVRFGLGAGVEPELHGAFEERFSVPLIEVWGMTETGRFITNHVEPRQVHTRAFGRPGGGIEARVVDDQDNDVPVGEPGELIVRHSAAEPRKGFFAGYLKNEAATAEAWRNGWFHTGDTVRQDDSGMLYFVDRKKNIIRRSGENIAAAEIEACLQAHPEVAQVAVLAVPDELRDEEVMACVVAMPDAPNDAEQARRLFDWCFERLAYYKAPGWLLFVEALPTTGTQKVQKQQIFPAGMDPRQSAGICDFRELKKRSRQVA